MSNINLNQDMQTLEVGLKQATITGVLLHAGQNAKGEALDYLAGTDTNVLEVNVPNGTLAIAQTILDGLKLRGYRYQPFNAERTITDPAIEIGDNVTANGTKAVVMGYDITHSRLMAPTLKAPYDEEVNHEFKFETRSERNFRRESAYTRSRLSINADNIEAKVSKIDGNETSFGWRLESDHWDLFSNGTTVLHATKDGIQVKGRITATSGYIGTESSGFEIGSRYIRNGMSSLTDTQNNGIYIGTDGISLGGGKFKVDSYGNLTASSGTFTGNVYAGNIKYGIENGINYGTMGGGGITSGSIGTGIGSPLSSYAIGGIGGGVGFNNMNGQLVRAFVYGTTGNFSGGVSMTTLTASGISAGGGDNPDYHSISWATYSYPTGVSVGATATSTIYVNTTDGGVAQIHPSYSYWGSLSNDGSKFNYLKGA